MICVHVTWLLSLVTGGLAMYSGLKVFFATSQLHFAVYITQHGWMQCSGAFITHQMIITASSCFDRWDGDVSSFEVNDGAGWKSKVVGVFRYPRYLDNSKVDIALVKLRNARVVTKSTITQLELPHPTEDFNFIGSNSIAEATIVGFGDSYTGTDFVAMHSDVRMDLEECTGVVGGFDREKEICSLMNGNLRMCRGDEGAAAMVNNGTRHIIIGVYSRSKTKCNDHRRWKRPGASVYTRVSTVVPWILEKIKRYTNDEIHVRDVAKRWQEESDGSFNSRILADVSMDTVASF